MATIMGSASLDDHGVSIVEIRADPGALFNDADSLDF
jgi:hypothetical protein